jgi:beta-glucosidase
MTPVPINALRSWAHVVAVVIGVCSSSAIAATPILRCDAFASEVPVPAPLDKPKYPIRVEEVSERMRTLPHRVMFLGNSIVRLFRGKPWDAYLAPRGVLNAGINGDRTETLLWRLAHGNLDGPTPVAVVLLIGTNDLSIGRPPKMVAEGIRANLLYLRERLPTSRILLLGLLPRVLEPGRMMRVRTQKVNELLKTCSDGSNVFYADIGGVLLNNSGILTPEMSVDQLHPTKVGYEKLGVALSAILDKVVPNH